MGEVLQMSRLDASEPQVLTYEICSRDCIVAMSAGWLNGGKRHPALHRSLWDLLGDGNIADIYRALVTQIRRTDMGLCFTFRCDDFQTRRVMSMAMMPIGDGGIRFSSCPITEERQDTRAFTRRRQAMPLDIDVCPSCGDIRAADQWLAADAALERLGIFAEDITFQTRHALCPSCRPHGH